jgi:cyclopropane fatty-acyl-phospholipid synthase-like methyltransferase
MAQDHSLSRYEKIGFPDSYRKGREKRIFRDIVAKLPSLLAKKKVVLDIGPGCSELSTLLINLCRKNHHTLILVDSEEMLSHLPDEPFVRKIAGFYPYCEGLLESYRRKVDVILTYSVLQYVFVESNIWDFLDTSMELLSDGGQMLIGDIPNVSKRKRFFSSTAGIRFHQEFTGTKEIPEAEFNTVERHHIDDAVVLALLARARNAGFDAYLLPQKDDLPMANRREDLLIRKP